MWAPREDLPCRVHRSRGKICLMCLANSSVCLVERGRDEVRKESKGHITEGPKDIAQNGSFLYEIGTYWRIQSGGVTCSAPGFFGFYGDYGSCVSWWRKTRGDAVSKGKAQGPVQRPLQQPRWQMACSGASGGLLRGLFTVSRNRKLIKPARIISATFHWKIHSKYIPLMMLGRQYHL